AFATLVSFTADLAFGAIQLFRGAAIETGDTSAEIARDAVRQREGIEAQIELAASFYAARPFHLRDRARDVTSGRDHDLTVDQDREHRLQINAVALCRMFCADAVDQA